MGTKRKTYITEPERLYVDPLHPTTSEYDVVIPKTTSDAVIVEGTDNTLTEVLEEVGGPRIDKRNTVVAGDDIIRVNGNTLSIGGYVLTISDGFTESGIPVDYRYSSTTYTNLPTPSSTDIFLIIDKNGNFSYVTTFYGGRDFPTSPAEGHIFYHEQLRRSYRFNGTIWVEFPCTAIARFENGQLVEILPYNTWWWNEVVWEETEPDYPAGMQVSVYEDINGDNYLRVKKGAVIDNGHIFKLDTDIYKKVQDAFVRGNGNGCGDGNYENTMVNIIPEDITPSDLQGFSVSDPWAVTSLDAAVTPIFASLNPTYNVSYPRWQVRTVPAQFTITFPEAKSINKYTIQAYWDSTFYVRALQSWYILGSNDGTNWEHIHGVENAGFTTLNEEKSFYPQNTKQYRIIKFIAQNNNGGDYLSMGQIRFYSSVPELNVFVITDDSTTDVLTSPYSGPALPMGYVYYHKIGVISIDENDHLFNSYPNTSMAVDAAGRYATLQQQFSTKANCSLSNINSNALHYIAKSVSPETTKWTPVSNNTTYKATQSGYVCAYNTTADTLIYNFGTFEDVSNSDVSTLVSGAPAGIPCWAFIKEGSYYKVVSNTAVFIKFIETVGQNL